MTPARPVVIVDACGGNLRSVQRALAAAGGAPIISADPDVVARAERVVIPGQGAFAPFMAGLAARGLDGALRSVLASGRPMLGICLGLQVLFERSAEHGDTAGLGLVAGTVERLTPSVASAKVPHIGWNQVAQVAAAASDPVLAGIPHDASFYFVHSYAVRPRNRDVVAMTCDHAGEIVAAIRQANLFACQFHPEKSQGVGLRLLGNFLAT